MVNAKRFELRDSYIKDLCLKFISNVDLDTEKPQSVVVAPFVHHRTTSQNRLWHSIVRDLASHLDTDVEKLKEVVKIRMLGYTTTDNPITGEPIKLVRHTSDLSVEEFDDLIIQTTALAIELGVEQ